jgi:branched-chain amino acid transport system ATP-binding protein
VKLRSSEMLELRHLMVFFENALAVNDLSVEVHRGEIVGVLGSNSAGKTTLMNAISGLIIDMKKKEDRRGGERITVLGELLFEGEDIMQTKPSERVRRGIVLSRERHPVFPESSVEENLKIAKYVRKDLEIKKSLEFIYAVRKRKAGFCSGGEQQMLSIGMALMTKPRLLLMDEPLLGLSPALQQSLVRTIRQIGREGVTILIAEQFARPLWPVIERGYVIENGILVLSDTGEKLRDNPEVQATYSGF